MSIHLERELTTLTKMTLTLGGMVEDHLERTRKALIEHDLALAGAVIADDRNIDNLEVKIEEECLKILALYQPVGHDLRYVVGVLKMNSDLERIGDLVRNFARKIRQVSSKERVTHSFDFQEMFQKARQMLQGALDAFVNQDASRARAVCAMDDAIDAIKRQAQKNLVAATREHPEQAQEFYAIMGIARNLERLADLATNMAEDVIYMVEGRVVRHQLDD